MNRHADWNRAGCSRGGVGRVEMLPDVPTVMPENNVPALRLVNAACKIGTTVSGQWGTETWRVNVQV